MMADDDEPPDGALDWNELRKSTRDPPTASATGAASSEPDDNVHPTTPVRATRYAQTALQRETEIMRAAQPGTRNQTLNGCAFNVAQIIGAGHIDEQTVRKALMLAALHTGLDRVEIDRTLDSALKAGI